MKVDDHLFVCVSVVVSDSLGEREEGCVRVLLISFVREIVYVEVRAEML